MVLFLQKNKNVIMGFNEETAESVSHRDVVFKDIEA